MGRRGEREHRTGELLPSSPAPVLAAEAELGSGGWAGRRAAGGGGGGGSVTDGRGHAAADGAVRRGSEQRRRGVAAKGLWPRGAQVSQERLGHGRNTESVIPPEPGSNTQNGRAGPGYDCGWGVQTRACALLHLPTKNIPASFLKQIANDFSPERELGKGVFGIVYKLELLTQGILEDGEVIAVKKLVESSLVSLEKTFSNEVGNLMVVQHEDIVKLVGFCHETHKKVFYSAMNEYLPKGSLDKYIFAQSNRIDCDIRFKVIRGICNGLYFLHNKIHGPVVHMDLKPENILLDDNMVPKIVDFGLS
ncbi:hypothetical protein U9M48_004141 [Paspalum notatum var. saurae]|uniref:Protein kinase domain-containing protein n=1 Tax=Paspalum notatum var. saurae TaxID=547442 RepID=A0AAQ3SKJ8_PASNO